MASMEGAEAMVRVSGFEIDLSMVWACIDGAGWSRAVVKRCSVTHIVIYCLSSLITLVNEEQEFS